MAGTTSITAVCISCGAPKKRAPGRCTKCGFVPSSNIDTAKSFILSRMFEVGDRSIGRSPSDLAQISRAIAAGSPYQFAEAEVAAVVAEVAAFKSITARHLALDLIKWLGPPVLILAIVYALLRST
jgi:hypothetical protein